ncbi:MAG: hypothetical protein KAG56_06320 [Sulfurovaceae bacterium]|nr:hypothetical protein [Sulfurovaceae bacterium]
MSLKRFKNELVILTALLFVGYAFFYKISAEKSVLIAKQEISSSLSEISKVAELKSFWNPKKIKKEADKFKDIVAQEKVKRFEKRSQKVTAIYQNLSVKELNKISKKLLNTHFKISKLKIEEIGKDRFNMEFTCKW